MRGVSKVSNLFASTPRGLQTKEKKSANVKYTFVVCDLTRHPRVTGQNIGQAP
jgi:hypothetical protein